MGLDTNKVYLPLLGKPALRYSLQALQQHERVQGIVLVCAPGEKDMAADAACGISKLYAIVEGGSTRADSVKNGLSAVPQSADAIAVQDGARPLLCREILDACFECLDKNGSAVAGAPLNDTIKKADPEGKVLQTVDRSGIWTVQTPQVFDAQNLRKAYERQDLHAVTDDASLMELAGYSVHLAYCGVANGKLTRKEDISLLEKWLEERQ